jgi:triacylglycerol lipase
MEVSKQMVLFSFLAYYDFYQPDVKRLEDNVTSMLKSVKTMLKFSEISWGPIAYKNNEYLSDSLIYVVKNKNLSKEEEYTIVIRGTNPFSLSSWLFQDLNVAGLTPWSRQLPSATTSCSYISKATDTSLHIHKNLTSNGQTVLCWLNSVIDSTDKNIHLNICGHSLGGLMATTFALWLHDELSASEKINRVDMQVYAFAGPTAGNDVYVEYLNTKLRLKYKSFENKYDIATHAWEEDDMKSKLPDIYGDITMNNAELAIYNKLVANISGLTYKKIGNIENIDSHVFEIRSTDYIVQAIYQHVIPYLSYSLKDKKILTLALVIKIIIQILSDLSSELSEIEKERVTAIFIHELKTIQAHT